MRASRRAGKVGLRIENQFEMQAPIDDVWNYLLDVERVAPCMPGAELTEVVDENTYKGKAGVKLGPVNHPNEVTHELNKPEHQRVMMTNPAAGTVLPRGSNVELAISSGR